MSLEISTPKSSKANSYRKAKKLALCVIPLLIVCVILSFVNEDGDSPFIGKALYVLIFILCVPLYRFLLWKCPRCGGRFHGYVVSPLVFLSVECKNCLTSVDNLDEDPVTSRP